MYAFDTQPPLAMGEWRTLTLKSVRATERTEIEVLGQSGTVLEYQPEVDPKTRWQQDGDKLYITFCRTQRLYNNRKWPNSAGAEDHECGRSLSPLITSRRISAFDTAMLVIHNGVYTLPSEAPNREQVRVMALYISISANLRSSEDMIAVVDALMHDDRFAVVSICSLAGSKTKPKWFLSGYGVESILDRFDRYLHGSRSEVTLSFDSGRNKEYLRRIEELVAEGWRTKNVSPFERISEYYTFIDVHMQTYEKSVISNWIDEIKVARIFVYPCVKKRDSSFDFPFRHKFLDWGFRPTIEVTLTKHPKMGYAFNVYSASQIWLQNGMNPAYNGMPSADVKLTILSQLVERALLPTGVKDIDINLSNSAFHKEAERIRDFFQSFNVTVELS